MRKAESISEETHVETKNLEQYENVMELLGTRLL